MMVLHKNLCFIVLFALFSFFSSSTTLAKKSVYGYLEPVALHPDGISVTAKLDTGADTASLSATGIRVYERVSEQYVKFKVSHPEVKEAIDYDLPLVRHVKIKGRAIDDNKVNKPHLRPVVGMQIYFDGKPHIINFNLIDRSHFSTPILLGRKALAKLGVIVDGTARNTILKKKSKQLN